MYTGYPYPDPFKPLTLGDDCEGVKLPAAEFLNTPLPLDESDPVKLISDPLESRKEFRPLEAKGGLGGLRELRSPTEPERGRGWVVP